MIDIIVPVYNNINYTKLFLLSLQQQTYKKFRVIIINNWSNDGTLEFLQSIKFWFQVFIINNDKNLWYVKAINQWILASNAEYLLFWNNDTICSYKMLESLISNIGDFWILSVYTNSISKEINSPLLINYEWNDTIDDINSFSDKLSLEFWNSIQEVDAVFWHCMFVTNKVIKKIKGLDEEFWMWNYDDIDFCMRAKRTWFNIGLFQWSFIYHYCHKTFNSMWIDVDDLIKNNFNLYQKKWAW